MHICTEICMFMNSSAEASTSACIICINYVCMNMHSPCAMRHMLVNDGCSICISTDTHTWYRQCAGTAAPVDDWRLSASSARVTTFTASGLQSLLLAKVHIFTRTSSISIA